MDQSTAEDRAPMDRPPIELVAQHLDELGVDFEVVDHPSRFTAAREARAAGIEPENAAKSVLLREGADYRLAVLPASERLDIRKVRRALNAGKGLRLATEEEMAADYPQFELGAIPSLGELLPAPEIVDRRLLDHDRVLCNGGDHAHSLLIDPEEMVRVAGAQPADICEEAGR